MLRIRVTRSLLAGTAMLAAGCGSGMMDAGLETQLLSVSPRGGAVGVATVPDIELTFSQPMTPGTERYLALHRGGLTDPTMPMNCNWSDGQTTLVCRPTQPLAPSSAYTIHMGGGMMDADGQSVAMGRYGTGMGGNWATGAMMGGQQGMMGTGWQNANDSYGMWFDFTTQ